MKMTKMWGTRTPRESKFKHILQHIPVKNTPSISILKKTFFYICHITNRQLRLFMTMADAFRTRMENCVILHPKS